MIHFAIIPVGRTRDPRLAALCEEFTTRLGRYARVREQVVRDAKAVGTAARAANAKAILRCLRPQEVLVALDEQGASMTSVELARWLQKRATGGSSRFAFAIAGPDGQGEAVLSRAALRLSLSKMTFTHEMAKVILLEQLYRAMTIWRGEPYHK